MSTSEDIPAAPGDDAEYAGVEIKGHRRHFGRIAEVERFGGRFLRIDVPLTGSFDAGWVSYFYAPAAIFSIRITDRETVEAHNRAHDPLGMFSRALSAGNEADGVTDIFPSDNVES